jgi:hypothetical protein
MSDVAISEQTSPRAFFCFSALLFLAGAALTIVWCASPRQRE